MRYIPYVISVLCIGFVIVGMGWSDTRKPDVGQPKTPPKDPNPLKLPTRQEVMAAKLKYSQAVLEGIALNDFDRIETAAKELLRVSNASEFLNAYRGPEYQFHTMTFRRIAETLPQKAKDKNIDGVMVTYNDLTLSCLKCHQAMRDKKFDARIPLDRTPDLASQPSLPSKQ